MTILQQQNTIWGIFNFANTSTDGMLFGLFMISIFFVMIMSLKQYEIPNAILASSFMCFILSSLLTYAQVLNLLYPLMFLGVAALTAFYKYLS